MKLSNDTLSQLPQTIGRPSYDRAEISPGIVHIGLGNFHRAHQAWYLHELMQQGLAMDWGIIGAGVRAADAGMRDRLLAQDCLTTLIELDPTGRSAEVIGPMIDFLPVEDGNASLIRTMASPAIRIVSLTVTEGGYYQDAQHKGLDLNHDDIQHDITRPDRPRTVFGAIVEALRLRRGRGLPAFTVQSCDNLQGNGKITRAAVVTLAQQTDPELAAWIDRTGAFPNSMVDCIVPATGPAEIALAQGYGIEDTAPVTHENYRHWVIEDEFCAGRPPWNLAGAIFTDNVHGYESMKIRVLNAGHQVLANAGELLSIATIADCMKDPLLADFFRKVQTAEILPHVTAVPEMASGDYLTLIEARFSNPEIRDTTRRVAYDGSSRHPGFVLPILRDAVRSKGAIDGLCLVEALWAQMCTGQREDGSDIAPNDPDWEARNSAAERARKTPETWVQQSQIYGDLSEQQDVVARFSHWLSMIQAQGCRAALREYLGH
ncbi:mannitol dehydrogenase family protein [Phaeobacter gallaeciensis]|uniref:Mannitol 2-dehydrogenase MtlK n=1 Tax=Phaeobacter gallaeciensis TaxID=60890 RepID=A0AAC9Z8C0_9RHOB|nr:mannitol dehydrogenase family protein [Phaeobacter gallaeciensis]AHD09837.1 Mannitol-1-phosphate/altronate dehydrogenase [Phaeobacter gallaeciensis DSM 26640]ATE93101.1 mannitol 2-dehydrogenase MtlK [Phaeobacter gallaeciensis]ATE97077.1 mannitol 2-dehydrogenase MtlK [Phaeobacter gallaeciensis]ATF01766.1 mannitol 2-dehydrogenase MtlK [Phaeobacter gallaeciensis]ATF06146.1 mannitol 2-dehydrogenase MtlK [Phaeobacter gallaeciensis]